MHFLNDILMYYHNPFVILNEIGFLKIWIKFITTVQNWDKGSAAKMMENFLMLKCLRLKNHCHKKPQNLHRKTWRNSLFKCYSQNCNAFYMKCRLYVYMYVCIYKLWAWQIHSVKWKISLNGWMVDSKWFF